MTMIHGETAGDGRPAIHGDFVLLLVFYDEYPTHGFRTYCTPIPPFIGGAGMTVPLTHCSMIGDRCHGSIGGIVGYIVLPFCH